MMMVEITMNNSDVAKLMRSLGYVLIAPEGTLLELEAPSGNVFALCPDARARILKGLIG